MLNDLKSIFLLFCVSFSTFSCNGQTNSDAFNVFLANFEDTKLPLNAIEFIVNREANLNTKKILDVDFNKYLREKGDTFWKFKEYFEYRYGGKLKVNDRWVVFYSRHFDPDNVFMQKGEFVLVSFSLEGELISTLPIAGGYGDSLIFSSIISDFRDIKINFIFYQNDKESNYIKSYFLDIGGTFRSKPDDKLLKKDER